MILLEILSIILVPTVIVGMASLFGNILKNMHNGTEIEY